MLIVHHLQRSQSERIVWLCEELEIPYELKIYKRDSKTFLAPPELKALHPMKSAPIIQDGPVTLAESGAIVEYILTKYGRGKLVLAPDHASFADYLFFFHFANSSFQPTLLRTRLVDKFKLPEDDPSIKIMKTHLEKGLGILNDRLKENPWLAGDEFTAAEIMIIFSLTTMRLFVPYSFEGHDAIAAWLQRAVERPAYKRARDKGDPGMKPLITADPGTDSLQF